MKKLSAAVLLALAIALPASAGALFAQVDAVAGFAHGPLRLFTGLFSLVLAAQFLFLFLRGGGRELIILPPALVASAAAELGLVLLAPVAPASSLVAIEGAALFIAGGFLILFILESLKILRGRIAISLLAPAFLVVCVGLAIGGRAAELAPRAAMALCHAAVAGLCAYSLLKASFRRAAHPFLLLLLHVLQRLL